MSTIHWTVSEDNVINKIINKNPGKSNWNISDITSEYFNKVNAVSDNPRTHRAIRNKIDKTIQKRDYPRFDQSWTAVEDAEVITLIKGTGQIEAFCKKAKRPRYQVDQRRTYLSKYKGVSVARVKNAVEKTAKPAKRKYVKRTLTEQTTSVATKNKTYNDKDAAKKNYIQNLVYNEIRFAEGEFVGQCTALLGPVVSWLKAANLIRKHIAGDQFKILSFENNPALAAEQLSRKNELPGEIGIYADDVKEAKATQFMDIDLMKTYPTVRDTTLKLFNAQKELDTAGNKKVFIFTLCLDRFKFLNKISIPTIETALTELLGQKVEVQNLVESDISIVENGAVVSILKKVREYIIKPCEGYKIIVHNYSDSVPMINIAIEYR